MITLKFLAIIALSGTAYSIGLYEGCHRTMKKFRRDVLHERD